MIHCYQIQRCGWVKVFSHKHLFSLVNVNISKANSLIYVKKENTGSHYIYNIYIYNI